MLLTEFTEKQINDIVYNNAYKAIENYFKNQKVDNTTENNISEMLSGYKSREEISKEYKISYSAIRNICEEKSIRPDYKLGKRMYYKLETVDKIIGIHSESRNRITKDNEFYINFREIAKIYNINRTYAGLIINNMGIPVIQKGNTKYIERTELEKIDLLFKRVDNINKN